MGGGGVKRDNNPTEEPPKGILLSIDVHGKRHGYFYKMESHNISIFYFVFFLQIHFLLNWRHFLCVSYIFR